VLFTCDAPGGAATVFFDPNELSPDGTIALGGMAFTNTGALNTVVSLALLRFYVRAAAASLARCNSLVVAHMTEAVRLVAMQDPRLSQSS
jgi:hypothetical protein